MTENQDVEDVKWSPDGKYIAVISSSGEVRLWNLSGNPIARFRADSNGLGLLLIFSPDSKQIATYGQENIVRLWSLSGQKFAEFKEKYNNETIYRYEPEAIPKSVAFSPDGKQIAIAWDRKNDQLVQVFPVFDNLDQLLAWGCEWLKDYLHNSTDASERDRQMCGITKRN